MSLIPYHPREGREIVLRHHNAIVVRDPSSQRLEIRGLQLHECPTCHQPLRSSSPERHFDDSDHGETYVDPDYFRMLRAGHRARNASQSRPPPSPIRRLVEPVAGEGHHDVDTADGFQDAEFVSSAPASHGGSRIRRQAFSPNYFNTFFIEERELGRGGKGVVLLVRHEIDGCNLGHFACKRVPVGDDHAWLEKVLIEVELLAKLSHSNLVSYRHVWLEDVQLTRFGPSVACAFILQQYCNGGDLLHYVIGDMPRETTKEELKAQMRRRSKGQAERPQIQKRLPPEEIYSLFKDITSGLAYLHATNYIHRDLKPSNCLLHRDGSQLKCLISDFGEVQPENVIRKSTGSTGTISYCAPEVLKKDASGRYGNFTTKSDIFSLGLILYFMCFGRLPYENANTVREELEDVDQLRAEISDWKGFQDERRERPDLPSKLYQLLKRLLSVNPAERPTANEVLYAMKGESSLDGLMRGQRNPSPNIGIAGQRIQNLDSPMSPGSPVADPAKPSRTSSSPDDEVANSVDGRISEPSAQATSASTFLTKRVNPPPTVSHQRRHPTSHAMTLSLSNHNHSHSHSHSPTRSASRSPEGAAPATITTPLLMPPPMTPLERLRQGAALEWHRAAGWLRANAALLRLLLFAAKLISLSWVCWPFSARWGVMGAVVVMAGADLQGQGWEGERGTGRGRGRGISIGDGQSVAVREGDGGGGASRRWLVGWRRTLVLLVLHCAVLAVTFRLGVLCAGGGRAEWRRLLR